MTQYFLIDSPFNRTVAGVLVAGPKTPESAAEAASDLKTVLDQTETIKSLLPRKPRGMNWTNPKNAHWCKFGHK